MLFIPLPRKTTRKGTPRSRTGCSTCKIRRVKCDETHPVCIKCTSTGRKCPGYVPPVPKASGSLQNIRPAVIPGAGGAELRSLDLLRRLIAPGLTEPIPESFWTYDIPQAAHQEPTILHAAVAASSLYEACRDDSHVGVRQRQFAMQHYNKAIQQILTSQVEHLDSVVMACLAFIRIEFLLGNIKGAYTHYHHGKVLLKSYNPSQQLLTIFRRLDIFILLFSQLADLSSVDDAAIMTSDEKPGNSDKSEKVIDWLARRSMRMTLLFSELSSTSSPLLVPMASPASSVSSQAIPAVDPILKQTLDSWSLAVACLVVSNSLRPDKTELDCMLQARLLVCKLSLIMETHAGVPNRVNEAKPGRLVGIISDVMGFDSNLTVEAINLGAKITCRALICASNMDKSDLNMEDIEKGLGIGED